MGQGVTWSLFEAAEGKRLGPSTADVIVEHVAPVDTLGRLLYAISFRHDFPRIFTALARCFSSL